MNPAPHDPLFRSFEAAAGRDGGADLSPALLAFARRVVAAGQALLAAEPCPSAALRRAEALFVAPRRATARLLALIFDSWSALAPATRGRGPRLLRFGGGDLSLDVELEPRADGRTRLRLALAPDAGLSVALELGGRVRPLRLDASGGGEALLPVRARGVRLVLRRGRLRVARTPPLPRD
jgi:hypothetical protein